MSKYFTQWDDFSVDVIGTNIAGWTSRGAGASSRPPAYGALATVPVKRRYLAYTLTSSGTIAYLSWDLIDADSARANFDICTLFIGPLATVDDNVTVFARGVGTAPYDCYQGLLSISSNLLAIQKLVASAGTTLSSSAFTVDLAKSYFIRFRGQGTTLQLKAWDAALGAAGEPAAWNTTVVDSTFTAAGSVGLGDFEGAGAGEIAPFNFFSVGTGGDSAQCPITNTEYSNWLDGQPSRSTDTMLRCVLAEFSCTGYTAAPVGSPSDYTTDRNVYIANMGYTSKSWDSPATRHYDDYIEAIPTFSREMGVALSGQASVGFGDLIVRNSGIDHDKRQNLLMYSNYQAARWTDVFGLATFTTGQSDPFGGTNAVRIDLTTGGSPTQTKLIRVTPGYALTANGRYKLSFWAKLVSGVATSITSDINDSSSSLANYGAQLTVGDWVFCTINIVDYTSDTTLAFVDIVNNTTASAVIDFFGLHLRRADRSDVYIGTTGTIYSPAIPAQSVGQLDDWLRIHWNRNYFKMYLGDPSWPKHDFRTIIYGRIGNPTAPTPQQIRFPIADLSDFFSAQVNSTLFSSGDYSGQYKPELFGQVQMCEPPMTNAAGLVLTVSRRPLQDLGIGTPGIASVYDDGVELRTTPTILTVSSIDTTTNEIIFTTNHGMVANYVAQFTATLPTVTGVALATNTDYCVHPSGLDRIRLTRSFSGGSPTDYIDFTNNPASVFIAGYGYRCDAAAATITLAASPAGRITAAVVDDAGVLPGQIYNEIAVTAMGLSLNHKDAATFDALDADLSDTSSGMWLDTTKQIGLDTLARYSNGTRTWFGMSPDALMQVGNLSLPEATAVMSFIESDIARDSLKMVDVIRAIDFSKAQISYLPFFLTKGLLVLPATYPINFAQNKAFVAPYVYGTAAPPLDNYPAASDANTTAVFDTVYTGYSTLIQNWVALYIKKLGIFEFQTSLRAVTLSIGDTISLTHSRLGWKQWTASDPASSDNLVTIDSRLAVVIGHNVNLQESDPLKQVTIKCFRQIPGYYPTADLN